MSCLCEGIRIFNVGAGVLLNDLTGTGKHALGLDPLLCVRVYIAF